MYLIQELMQPAEAHESSDVYHEIPPVITPILMSTPNLKAPPFCKSCQLACSKWHAPKVKQPAISHEDQMGLYPKDTHEDCNFISVDLQLIIQTDFSWDLDMKLITINIMAILFHDAAASHIWTENQISLGAGEPLMAKKQFEQWLWVFVKDCKNKYQTHSFSGIGADHRNEFTNDSIPTLMHITRAFIVHSSLQWSKSGANFALGIFMKHAVWLQNHISNHLSGLSPMELLIRTKAKNFDIFVLMCVCVGGVSSL